MAIAEGNGSKKDSGSKSKYLTFHLGKEKYGIPVLKTREIVGAHDVDIHEVPNFPACHKGVIELRNEIFSIIDLKAVFDMGDVEINNKTSIVIVEVQNPGMLKCWEAKSCVQDKCPAYGSSDLRCWMIPKTFCGGQQQGSAHQKEEACKKCEVRIHSDTNKSVVRIGLLVDYVDEVMDFLDSEIQSSSSVAQSEGDYVTGFGKKQTGGHTELVMFFDIDKALAGI